MAAQFTKSHIITFKSAQLKFLQLKSKISVTGQEIYPYSSFVHAVNKSIKIPHAWPPLPALGVRRFTN